MQEIDRRLPFRRIDADDERRQILGAAYAIPGRPLISFALMSAFIAFIFPAI